MKKLFSLVMVLAVLISFASISRASDFKAMQLISGTYTATTNGSSVDTTSGTTKISDTTTPAGREGVLYLNVGSVTGSSPTLDVTIQDSPDGATWYTLQTFTQVTSNPSTAVKRYGTDFYSFGRYVRARCVIGGTTPSFKFFIDMNIRR